MRKRISVLTLFAITALLTGCGTNNEQEVNEESSIAKVEKMDDLAEGAYYVEKNDGYEQLYFGDTSFSTSDVVTGGSADTTRVAWFGSDWGSIPTLYKGESLVYKYTGELTESFAFERFKDYGYTVGICDMEETDTGRYLLSLSSDDHMLATDSKAYMTLTDIGSGNVIVEAIGGKKIRSGNITAAGTIDGLEEGNEYSLDIYTGTKLRKTELTADVRALGAIETYISNSYEFLRSDVISIEIPEWFNSGYYSIDGYGIFRYVNGSSYDDTTDFSVANQNPDAGDLDEDDLLDEKEDENRQVEEVYVAETGTYLITVTYDDDYDKSLSAAITSENDEKDIDTTPVAVLRTYNDSLTLKDVGGNQLQLSTDLEMGNYTLTLTNLLGRDYDFTVKMVSAADGTYVDSAENVIVNSEPEADSSEDSQTGEKN